jgi:hypothetical protein
MKTNCLVSEKLDMTLALPPIMCVVSTVCVGQPVQSPSPNQIQHFGFSIVDAGHDDPHDDEVRLEYVDEVAGFSTFADLAPYFATEDISPRIDAMTQRGLKVFLHAQGLLFDHVIDADSPTGVRYVLRADAADRFSTFVQINALDQHQDDLVAIYLADEPAWNRLDDEELRLGASIVESELPDVPIAVIEAAPAIDELKIPESVDWVGFDRYAVGDPSTDPQWQQDLQSLIDRRTREDQRVIIVMETQWIPEYTKLGYDQSIMGAIATNTLKAAQACPHAIAIVGYSWPGGLDRPEQLGARQLPPDVQSVYRQIGRRIKQFPRP